MLCLVRLRLWLMLLTAAALALAACEDEIRPAPLGDGFVEARAADGGSDTVARDQSTWPEAGGKEAGGDAAGDAAVACNSALSLSPMTIATDWCTIWRFDLNINVAVDAIALAGNTLWIYYDGSTPFKGYVTELAIDPISGSPKGQPQSFFSFNPGLTTTCYPGEYLARSPTGLLAAGYTDATLNGTIYWGPKSALPPKPLTKATGNYDVVFLDDKTLLINGQGVETAQNGQGVYLAEDGKSPRLLIKDLGTYSGHLALGQNALYAGGYMTGGGKVYGLSLAEVKAAITSGVTLSATGDGDLVFAGSALDATALGDDLVVAEADSSFTFTALSVTPITVSGNKVIPASGKRSIVTVGGSAKVKRVVSDGQILGLLISGAKTSIEEQATIRKK